MDNSISRRLFIAGSAVSSAAVLAPRPALAEGAAILASKDSVDFLYIDSSVCSSGIEQNIALGLNRFPSCLNACLLLVENGSGDQASLELSRSTESSLLFTSTELVPGFYRVSQLTFDFDESSYVIDFSDCASSSKSFYIVERASDSVSVVNSLTSFDESYDEDIDVSGSVNCEDSPLGADEPSVSNGARAAKLHLALNPGHGGNDAGAGGYGVLEASCTWKICQYCKAALEQYGNVDVYVTRERDENPGLKERVDRAANAGCDVYVSLHINAGGGHGAEVWVPYNSSYNPSANLVGVSLGDSILSELTALGLSNRGTKTRVIDDELSSRFGYDSNGDGVVDTYADYYADIRYARMAGLPGIIVEHAFIDSSDCLNYLNSDDKLRALGEADAHAIANYYGLALSPVEGVKMFRLYNPFSGEHLYSSSADEIGACILAGWKFEGHSWTAPKNSSAPVYRLYNRYTGDHHYTASSDERSACLSAGWFDEGIGWYSWAARIVPVYREYNRYASVGSHNYTTDRTEHFSLVHAGWADEGISWYAMEKGDGLAVKSPGGTADSAGLKVTDQSEVIYRLYNKWTGEHFYTQKPGEIGNCVMTGWSFEGPAWLSPKQSGTPVYRLYNKFTGDHHYTVDQDEKDALVSSGWADEGITWYSDDARTVPIYRQFNRNASTGTHNYTGSRIERRALVNAGWVDEGISWFAMAIPEGDEDSAEGKTLIMGSSQATSAQMAYYFKKSGHQYPSEVYKSRGATTIEDFCKLVLEKSNAEGVRAEVVFCQSMHETGWLQFGGQVKPEQCNFAGVGATNDGAAGATFPDVGTGLLAQVQHLKAYASTEGLNCEVVDPRFSLVKRGIAPYLEDLDGRWAVPGVGYGEGIRKLMDQLLV